MSWRPGGSLGLWGTSGSPSGEEGGLARPGSWRPHSSLVIRLRPGPSPAQPPWPQGPGKGPQPGWLTSSSVRWAKRSTVPGAVTVPLAGDTPTWSPALLRGTLAPCHSGPPFPRLHIPDPCLCPFQGSVQCPLHGQARLLLLPGKINRDIVTASRADLFDRSSV